jgi:hypothetical protein
MSIQYQAGDWPQTDLQVDHVYYVRYLAGDGPHTDLQVYHRDNVCYLVGYGPQTGGDSEKLKIRNTETGINVVESLV